MKDFIQKLRVRLAIAVLGKQGLIANVDLSPCVIKSSHTGYTFYNAGVDPDLAKPSMPREGFALHVFGGRSPSPKWRPSSEYPGCFVTEIDLTVEGDGN